MPITWRNVNGGSDATAASLLRDAGQSFNQMTRGLGDIVEQQGTRLTNRDTEAFRQLLSQRYGNDPTALQEAQQNGELAGLRDRFSYLDQAQTGTEAINQMVGTLQERALLNQEHQDNQTRVANRGLHNQYNSELASGDVEGAQAILEANQDRFMDTTPLVERLNEVRSAQADRRNQEQKLNLLIRADNRAAETHQWTQQERYRQQAKRELETAQAQQVQDLFAKYSSPLSEGETYTQRKAAMLEELQSDRFRFMNPGGRTQLLQQMEEAVAYGEAVATGDQARINSILAPKERAFERNVFRSHETREADNGTLSRSILADYTRDDEDSNLALLLGEGDANQRLEIGQRVQAALSGRAPDGTIIHEGGIPESYVRMALDGVKGVGWTNWDKAFQDQLEKVTTSGAFLADYEDYVSKGTELKTLRQQSKAAARQGDLPSASFDGATASRTTPERSPALSAGGADTREPSFLRDAVERMTVSQGRAVPPVLSNGRISGQPTPASVTGQTPSIPEPEPRPMEEANVDTGTWESGFGKLSRVFGNAKNTFLNWRDQMSYDNKVNTFDEMVTLIDGPNGSDHKHRLKELLVTNPGLLRFMSAQQKNTLRDIVGEGMVNRYLKQTE